MKSLFRIQRGFTLIELLIVIAVLGVLAAVVLVAINPLEQLKKGRDAGRISDVAQLGHAMQTYTTSQNLTGYPTTFTAPNSPWQTALKNAGELGAVVTAPAGSTCAGGTSTEGNICYITYSSGVNFGVYVSLESQSSLAKATGCTTAVVAAFLSSSGKAGIACVGSAGAAPTETQTLY